MVPRVKAERVPAYGEVVVRSSKEGDVGGVK